MEFNFEVKEKKVTIKLYGVVYPIRIISVKESKDFRAELKSCNPEDALSVYDKLFLGVGIPQEAIDKFDMLDYSDVLNNLVNPDPKKS